MRRLSALILHTPLNEPQPVGDTDDATPAEVFLEDLVRTWTVTERLEQPSEAVLELTGSDLPIIYDDGDGETVAYAADRIPARAIIEAHYTDGERSLWRVARRTKEHSSAGDRISLRPLWMDLAGHVPRDPSQRLIGATFFSVPADEALERLFDTEGVYGDSIPRIGEGVNERPLFVAGTVDTAFVVDPTEEPVVFQRVFLRLPGGSFLDAVQGIAGQITGPKGSAEWKATWDPELFDDKGAYRIDLVERVSSGRELGGMVEGWKNRMSLRADTDDAGYFSHLIPLGTGDQEPSTIADASWTVLDTEEDGTELIVTLQQPAVWEDGCLDDFRVRIPGRQLTTAITVVESTAPRTVKLSSIPNPLPRRLVFLASDGEDIVEVGLEGAVEKYGRVEEVREYDVPPYPNLVADSGGEADLVGVDLDAPPIVIPDPVYDPLATTPVIGNINLDELLEVETEQTSDETSGVQEVQSSTVELEGRFVRFGAELFARTQSNVSGIPINPSSGRARIEVVFELLNADENPITGYRQSWSITSNGVIGSEVIEEDDIEHEVIAPTGARFVRITRAYELQASVGLTNPNQTPYSAAEAKVTEASLELSSVPSIPAISIGRWVRTPGDVAWQTEDGGEHVEIGGEGIRVTAEPHEGVLIAVTLLDDRPYASAFAALTVLSGQVRIAIANPWRAGYPKWPPTNEAAVTEPLADPAFPERRELTIFGQSPLPHRQPQGKVVTLEITAWSEESTFVLDAVTLTQSAQAYSYAENMGASGLWLRGIEDLLRDGGEKGRMAARLSSTFVDLALLGLAKGGALGDEIEVGDTVEFWESGPGTPLGEGVETAVFETRCMELRTVETLGEQRVDRQGRFVQESEIRLRSPGFGGPTPGAPWTTPGILQRRRFWRPPLPPTDRPRPQLSWDDLVPHGGIPSFDLAEDYRLRSDPISDSDLDEPFRKLVQEGVPGLSAEVWQTTLPEPTEDDGALVFDLPPPVNLRQELEEDLWGLDRDRAEPSEDSVKGRLGVAEDTVSTHGTRLDTAEGDISDLETDVGMLITDVGDLEDDFYGNDVLGTLDLHGGNIGDLSEDLWGETGSANEPRPESVKGRVIIAEGDIGDLETDVGTLIGDVGDLEEGVDAAVKLDSNGAADKAFMSIAAIEVTDELSGALPGALPVVGNIEMTNGRIIQEATPTSDDHLVNKKYVDDELASPPGGAITFDDAVNREHRVVVTNGRITSWQIDESEQLA